MTFSPRSVLAALVLTGLGLSGLALPAAAAAELPKTYYVSTAGSDAADGLSAGTAWRTLAAASNRAFHAGDVLLLQGGASFDGMLYLDKSDTGLEVGSFGTGRATIVGRGNPAIFGYDTGALTVHDLNLVGDSAAFGAKGGFSLWNDLTTRLSSIDVHNVDVQGFKNGIEIGASKPAAGYAHVRITDVRAHGNRDAGVITYGPTFNASAPTYAHSDVIVQRTTADLNLGNPNDTAKNTGNGIVLGSVDSGSIIDSRANGNGSLCKASEGPAGIWTYDSRSILIARNTSTGNRTGGTADGDGFDLDQNVSSSVMEYNTSSNNDGAGFLVWTGQSNTAHHDNTVRYNTSTGDAKKNSWYGAITVSGKVTRTTVYENKVSTVGSASHAPAIAVKSGVAGSQVARNALSSASGYAVVNGPALSRSAIAFGSNTWATTNVQRVRWGSTTYSSVAAWTKATGQS